MTTVVSWINKENINFPNLWIVTDSRLSQESLSGTKPLFECGAKLFSIRVVCVKPNQEGFFNDIYFSTTIGMAFAGSSLLALNLYAFLSHTLGELASTNHTIPLMKNLADHVVIAFQSLLRNFIEKNMHSISCEISVFGNCPRTREFQLFHIVHQGKDTTTSFNKIDLSDDNTVHLMGNQKKEIEELIINQRASLEKKDISWWRAPKSVVEGITRGQFYDAIGGEIQLGICNPMGFKLFSICRPIVSGRPNITQIYQNIDLSSHPLLIQIGDCFVKTDSMI